MQGVPKKQTGNKVSSGFGDEVLGNLTPVQFQNFMNPQQKTEKSQNLDSEQQQSVLNLLNKVNFEMQNSSDGLGIESFLAGMGQQRQQQVKVQNQNKENQVKNQISNQNTQNSITTTQKSQKVNSGSENPDFKEYVIKPRKWVSSAKNDDDQNNNISQKNDSTINQKNLNDESINNVKKNSKNQIYEVRDSGQGQELRTKNYTMKKMEFENIDQELERDEQFDGVMEISDKQKEINQIKRKQQEELIKKQQLQKLEDELKQQENEKKENDKVYQMQKQVMELIMEKEKQNLGPGCDNIPSSQLEMYKYFNQMQKEEEEKAKKPQDQKDGNYYTPKLYLKEQRKKEIQQQTQEALDKVREQQRQSHLREVQQEQEQQNNQQIQNQEQNQNDYEEEHFNGEQETNDSSEYQNQVLQEISREIIQEKTDKKEATYKIVYNNEDVYEGEINTQNNLKDGWGTYHFQNGEKYEGFFDDDVIHGYGKYYFLGGHKYEGDWDQGVKCGVGELYYQNGDYYVGQFYNDSYHGEGKLVYKNGDIFEGSFQNGKKHGKGMFSGFGKTGRKIIGEWDNDELQPF